MGYLVRFCQHLLSRRHQAVGDEIYDAALKLARRQGRLDTSAVLPGEWL